MKKVLKITAIVLVALIAILIIIPFAFKGKIVEKINSTVNNELNARLEFSDVNLSLLKSFPDLHLELSRLSLVGVDSFAVDTLIAFDKMQANLNLLSVFGDEIKVRSVILEKPLINIIYLESGKANYDIAKTDSTQTEEDTISAESNFKMALKNFEIIDGTIIYDDMAYDMKATLTGVDYQMSGDFTADFTSLNNHLDIQSLTYEMEGINYLNNATVIADALVDADLIKYRFDLKENKIKLNEIDFLLDGFVEMPADDIITDITYSTQKAGFKQFLSLIPAVYLTGYEDLKASGSLTAKGWVKGTYSNDSIPGFRADVAIENGKFQYPDLPESVDNVNVNLMAINYGREGYDMDIDISKLHLEMAGNPFDVKMNIRTSEFDVAVNGNFVGILNFNSLKDIIPLDSFNIAGILKSDVSINGKMSDIENQRYENFKASGSIEMKDFFFKNDDLPMGMTINRALLAFSPQYIDLQNFDSKIGKSDMHLNGKVENYIPYTLSDEGVLSGSLGFSSRYLNVNQFMAEEDKKTESNETDTIPLTAFEIPANIDLRLNSKIETLVYDNIKINNVVGIITIKDQKATLENLKMNMLGGSLLMNGSYSAINIENPVVDFGLNISNLNIPETFKTFNIVQQLAPIAQKCQGFISSVLNISLQLDKNMNPLMNTINALGSLSSENIEVEGAKMFSGISSLLKNDKYKEVSLRDLKAAFSIENGNLNVKPFDINLAGNTATISGTQSLDKSIDFDIEMDIPRKQFGTSVNSLLNNITTQAQESGFDIENKDVIEVVISATNTVTNPKFSIRPKGVKKESVKEQVKERVTEEVKETIEEKKQEVIENVDKKTAEIMKKAETEADRIRKAAKESGDKLIEEADKQAQKLLDEAGNNPIKKKAAEVAGNQLRKQAKEKADNLNAEADKKANAVIEKANTEIQELKKKAD